MQRLRRCDAMTEGHGNAIEVEALRRIYPNTKRQGERVALDGVSLSCARGTWVALLGPNGSGKSTLLRILSTLDRADGGSARVMGFDVVREARRVRGVIGMVFQSAGLDRLLTVRENLLAQAGLLGMRGAESRGKVEGVIGRFGLEERAGERVGTLSGGLARRVDLARACLGGAPVLLLDEPSAGLDVAAREGFLGALTQERAERETTILHSTHDMAEAERADVVVMMCEGKIVASGAPGALRDALGERVVECEGTRAEVLEQAGLAVALRGGSAVGTGDPERVERAAGMLVRAGVSFRVQPPTLEDVYRAQTGRTLGAGSGT
ncbi:MAG: ABC transporter ATP-binding protein [Phycisphaeraceae bacterium]|nr:MAG: ABC transporter ATP-binding protein [Phycisphaeraceae bacterium]